MEKLGGRKVYSTIRKKPRSKSEFQRIYGSKERVLFVKGLPCCACGVVGYSENAHLLGNGGMSRKGAYSEIGPLCGQWIRHTVAGPIYYTGCHYYYDNRRSEFDIVHPGFDPEKSAAETEAAWQSRISVGSTGPGGLAPK